jgi:hypothetical protein
MSTVHHDSKAWFKVASFNNCLKAIRRTAPLVHINMQAWEEAFMSAQSRTDWKLSPGECGVWVSSDGTVSLVGRLSEPISWTTLVLSACPRKKDFDGFRLPSNSITSGDETCLFFPIGLIGPDSPSISGGEAVSLAMQISLAYREKLDQDILSILEKRRFS